MRPRFGFPSFGFALAIALMAIPASAYAQTGPSPDAKKPPRNPYGSPLDTLMSTHLWTDVPKTKDFVRETHPDPKSLDYVPLTGKDPERPKPRDKANIEALRAELEQDAARNDKRGKGVSVRQAEPKAKKVSKAKVSKARARKVDD